MSTTTSTTNVSTKKAYVPKIKIIWSFDFIYKNMTEHREEFRTAYQECYNELPESEEALDDFIEQDTIQGYQDDKDNVEFFEKEHGAKTYVVLADIATWHGVVKGGDIIEGMNEVLSRCSQENNEYYIEGKRMKIKAGHHDGTNCFEIRELTNVGLKYYEKHSDWYDPKNYLDEPTLHKRLFESSRYSREVTIWKEMYGM
jgi:hypothetical protein